MVDPRLAKAAQHWSQLAARPSRTRWWESKLIVRHINRRYCGEEVDGTDGGDIVLLRKIQAGKFERAVSIGCGSAYHELALLAAGVVGEFVLYELSETRVAEALANAKARGLADRITIHMSDPFEPPPKPQFDLVYWKDALHHMFDAHSAVSWSKQVLKPGGLFFMNEFVGPTYMQYTDRQLDLAEAARRALLDEFLVNPHDRKQQVGHRRARPTIAGMMAEDPTECADSSGILPAVRSAFPEVTVIPLGGIVYMLALNDILANMDEVKDAGLLRAMMLADDLCIEAGETLYSVAFARRPASAVHQSPTLQNAAATRLVSTAAAPREQQPAPPADAAAVADTTAALASCNVCGGSLFQPGPSKRLSVTGRLPCCAGCGSLERHRIARRIMDSLPDSLIAGKRVLQFNKDSSVNTARVAEHRVSEHGAPDSLDMQAIALEDGRYDWVVSHHAVNSIENDVKGLREMLRVAGPRGLVLLTVGNTSDRFDTQASAVATGPYRTFRHYGSDFVARFYEHVPNASALELVATDPCTAMLDVVFIYSRDTEVLREIGRVMAPKNVYARLTIARDLAKPAPAAPAGGSARSAAQPAPPAPAGASPGSVAQAQGTRDDPRWQPLLDELAEWKRMGRTPRFWVRDDDATRENDKLEALYQVCAANRVTLACSAIPMSMEASLIEWAKGKPWLAMLQHGFDHVNRADPSAGSSSEFPDERELDDALQAIRKGQQLMSAFGSALLPVFVPPWGNVAPQVTARLGELGFSGVSIHYLRQAPRQDGIAVSNTHTLLPRLTHRGWSFEMEPLVEQLTTALASVRARADVDPREPIGINTHHLSVGEAELLALDSLVYITRSRGAEWPHPSDLFGQAS